jgi:hypothetical protein
VLYVTHPGPQGDAQLLAGYVAVVNLLLIPLMLAGIFVMPFTMAWLEPKKAPTHREESRRPTPR